MIHLLSEEHLLNLIASCWNFVLSSIDSKSPFISMMLVYNFSVAYKGQTHKKWTSSSTKDLQKWHSLSSSAITLRRRPTINLTWGRCKSWLFTSTIQKAYYSDYYNMQRVAWGTKYLHNICTMLDQRRRRWDNVVQMLYKCFVFTGVKCQNMLFLCESWQIGTVTFFTKGQRPNYDNCFIV